MTCTRCETAPAVDERGFCGSCVWAVNADVHHGIIELHSYLRNWAEFGDWCDENDVA